jgi:2-polyprenyl-6-methoxyphenol hydroxylase-like FAD-dependent oxidoreductase
MAAQENHEVLIVGAGPVGLTLAIDLGQRGVRCLIIEKENTTGLWPKMDRSNARTMEFYRRLGIADSVRAQGYPPKASMDTFVVTRLCDPPIAHFQYPSVADYRNIIAETADHSQPLEPYQLVSQNKLEPLLKAVAESTPNVTVRYGCELMSFVQDDCGIQAVVSDAEIGTETLTAKFLVGCDGGTSRVRKQLGIGLQGQGRIKEMRQVSFRSTELYNRIPIGKGRHYYVADEHSSIIVVQGSRVEFTLHTTLPEDADFREAILDVIGFDFEFEVINIATWYLNLLVAERYRDSRVLLAGDAVHLLIPNGGLGMNTGVGDSMDLSWKLEAVIKGWGGDTLLDSYEIERRPVALRNVSASGWATEGVVIWRDRYSKAIRENSPAGDVERKELARIADIYHRRVHEMGGVELGYTYAGSPLICDELNNRPEWDTVCYTPHTRPGVRIPHIWLSDGRAMQDILGRGYSLIDLKGDIDSSQLEAVFASLGAPLDVIRLEEPHVNRVYACTLLLVRPDLHIVWRGEQLPDELGSLAIKVTGNQVIE